MFAQAPDTLWTKNYGGIHWEWGLSVLQTFDGGYVVLGITDSYSGNLDAYLIKTSSQGDSLWAQVHGGNEYDDGETICQTSDSGFIFLGATDSKGAGDADLWLVKTDAHGNILWDTTYGGVDADYGYSIDITSDGGYILLGSTQSYAVGDDDFWIIKTNANGDTLWTRTYGGTSIDRGYSVQQTADGGYICAGETFSFGSGPSDFLVLKTDADGNILWDTMYGGTGGECCWEVQQTFDGGYILAGITTSFGAGNIDAWLVKTNVNGDTLWTKTYGGSGNDYAYSVHQTVDGGYIVTGYTTSFGALGEDVWLVRADSIGNTLWTQRWGGIDHQCGFSVRETLDHGYVIAGYTLLPDKFFDVWLLKTEPEVGIEEYKPWRPHTAILEIAPNPFSNRTKIRYMIHDAGYTIEEITISIYDAAGRLVKSFPRSMLNSATQYGGLRPTHITWQGDDDRGHPVPTGIYFLSFTMGNYTETKKLLLIR